MELLKSPLYSKYKESNAKLINFAGWEMPISFSGLIQEHNSVRNSAGFFDISHMGIISIKGINPKEHIQKFFPTNIYSISKGQSCYSLLLNENGGIIDDLIIYDMGDQEDNFSEILLIVNASRYEIDLNWLKNNLDTSSISISNAKKNNVLMAIQGKNSFKHYEEWSNHSITHLQSFGCEYTVLKKFANKEKIFLSKTGYTGEKGLEILLPINLATNLWDFLVSKNIFPCGLGARDTLRLEAGLHLYGQDLNDQTTPYEAGLGWVVHLENNHDFFGRKALEIFSATKTKKKLVGLEIQGKAIARKDCKIFADKKPIGIVSSGSWSPTLEKAIAFAYLDYDYCSIGNSVDVEVRGRNIKAIISKRSFLKKNY